MRMAHWHVGVVVMGCVLIGGLLICNSELPSTFAGEAATEPDPDPSAPPADADHARLFDAQIAPLLARHCLECHDSASRQGRLDLSRQDRALAGGASGPVIVPGQASESLLWEFVEFDDMPPDGRPPLTPEEKAHLRQWIDAGAVWSSETIDPLAYTRDGRAAYQWVQRLTVPEYIETVRSAVGVDIASDARRLLPPDQRADGFSNTAYNLNVDLAHVEAYAALAAIIVGRMDVAAFATEFAPCRELTDDCLREVIAGLGTWLLRGPLQEHEIRAFLGVATAVADEGGDFDEAVRYVVEAMLQSPRFIYRIENQSGDGTARPVGDYELASRLSYMIWGGPPDKELMSAAEAGALSDRRAVAAQVQRMLQDPRAVERSAQFIHEWLNLDQLANLRPNPERFPHWNDRLAADMRNETLAFFKEVVWEQQRPLADLMNAQVTFATPRLAEHYGLEPEHAVGGPRGRELASIPDRLARGLQALYRFEEAGGDTVHDTSGAGEPLDLKIEDTSAVAWQDDGLAVHSATLVASDGPPSRLIDAVRASGEITLEAWVTPADTRQSGPARILTLSADSRRRNFTLGQEGDRYDARFRTTRRDANGLPSISSPGRTAETWPTHVVYTRSSTGTGILYVNGEEKHGHFVDGNLSNWDEGFRLALANELTRDRPWRGTYHLVAIYNRALSPDEIRAQGDALARYDLASVPARGGLLTQGSVLTVGGDDASMVARGLFILHDVLYSAVGSAPPCVDTTPVPTQPGMSQRAVSEARLADATCVGCHAKFEPLAFGLEKFDGIGAYFETDEHGNRLRDDGTILFPGEDEPVPYESSAELMNLLAGSERVHMNITRKVTQFALGRPLVDSDSPVLEEIHQAAQEGGGTYASLITAIAMSDLVQMTRTETNP